MNLMRICPLVPTALVAVVLSTACMPDASRRDRVDEAFLRIVAAEDARPTEGAQLDVLIRAARTNFMTSNTLPTLQSMRVGPKEMCWHLRVSMKRS